MMEDKSDMNVVETTLAVMIKFMFVFVVISIVGLIFNSKIDGFTYYIALFVFTLTVFISSYFAKDQLQPCENDIANIRIKARVTLFCLVFALLMICIGIFVMCVYSNESEFMEEYKISFGKNGEMIFSAILCAGILQPIMEEYFFRGKLLKSLLRYGYLPALLASTIAFTAIHISIIEKIIPAFILGFFSGVLFIATGNILLSAILHCTYNSVVIISTLAVKSYLYYTILLKIGILTFVLAMIFMCISKSVRTEIISFINNLGLSGNGGTK